MIMSTLLASFIVGYFDEESQKQWFPADGERIQLEIQGEYSDLFEESGSPDVDYITYLGEKQTSKILLLDTFELL